MKALLNFSAYWGIERKGGNMALLRPSLTLVLDLDERVAAEQTILEINRATPILARPLFAPTHAKARRMPPCATRRASS